MYHTGTNDPSQKSLC